MVRRQEYTSNLQNIINKFKVNQRHIDTSCHVTTTVAYLNIIYNDTNCIELMGKLKQYVVS